MAGPRTSRGRLALGVGALGALLLLASASSPWVQPARVPWPRYTDGVPDQIAHPSDLLFRVGAALIGAAALALVGAADRGVPRRLALALLALFGAAGIALGLDALRTVARYHGFGSMVANDMTLAGFHHGPLNYAELGGASLLLLSPLASLKASRRTGR